MKILKKRRGSRERGEEETKSTSHAPVITAADFHQNVVYSAKYDMEYTTNNSCD
jgi:hypothetical protein